MAKLSVDQALLKAKSHVKKGELEEAKKLCNSVLEAFPKNKRAQQALAALNKPKQPAATQGPPQDNINQLIDLYNKGQWTTVVEQAQILTVQYPDAFIIWNILGAAAMQTGQTDKAIISFKRVISIKPDAVEAYFNMGTAQKKEGRLDEAIASFEKALAIKPDYPDAYYNMGNALKDQGRLEDAIASFEKALAIKPDYASAHLNIGYILQTQDKLDEAIASFEKALAIKPDYPDAYYNMGNALKDQGRLEDAIASFEKALAIKPDYASAHLNIGYILQTQDKLDEAIASFEKALAIKPDYAEAFGGTGDALNKQGKLDEAIAFYNKALSLRPNYPEILYNMGNTLRDQGKLEEAIEAYNNALFLKPDYAEANNNKGVVLLNQGNVEAAITSLEEALLAEPNYAEAYLNMGNAVRAQDRLAEALEFYDKAVSVKPKYPEALYNMGVVLQGQDKLHDAMESYGKSLEFRADYLEAWLNGAEALEQWNKLEQLDLWLERAFQAFNIVPSDLLFMKAKLLWRNNEYKQATNLIFDIDYELLKENRKQDYFSLKAKCYEKRKNFDKAYECFSESNLLVKKSREYAQYNPDSYFEALKDTLTILESKSVQKPIAQSKVETDFLPVFLVGFPRSGTTLLDTILRSHSKIEIVEEQDATAAAINLLWNEGYDDLVSKIVPPKLITDAKSTYEAELQQHIESVRPGSVYIDKLPLNLLYVPLIHQMYPKAKFILALRHPLDTILSCWMQNFKLNPAMANMVDIDRIVEFYCIAMNIFKKCRARYNLSVHEIRYENLLESISGETSLLLDFLDLRWEAQMENYQETALKRGRINTPSYSQVVQPIYKDAKYRWVNYRKYLDQHLEKVAPWINEFDYSGL